MASSEIDSLLETEKGNIKKRYTVEQIKVLV